MQPAPRCALRLSFFSFLLRPPQPLAVANSGPCLKGGCPLTMLARLPRASMGQVVLLNSSKIFPSQVVTSSPTLRPHKSFSCNTYGSPGKCVANKRLTDWLSLLDATLTKNRGGGPRLSTFRRMPSSVSTAPSLLPIPTKASTQPCAIIGVAACATGTKASWE